MGYRKTKLSLYNKNPHCYWCGVKTTLTNISNLPQGPRDPNMATVDHIYSRLDPRRWRRQEPGEVRLVLACNKCNAARAEQECNTLSHDETVKRSKGFKLNKSADGNPIFTITQDSLKNIIDILKENGILLPDEKIKQCESECSALVGQ